MLRNLSVRVFVCLFVHLYFHHVCGIYDSFGYHLSFSSDVYFNNYSSEAERSGSVGRALNLGSKGKDTLSAV